MTNISYAYNWQVFDPKKAGNLTSVAPNGLSATLYFVERYSHCLSFVLHKGGNSLMGSAGSDRLIPRFGYDTHADPQFGIPIPPTPGANLRSETFQVAPCTVYISISETQSLTTSGSDMTQVWKQRCGTRPVCDPTLAQANATAGLVVANGDGSVRTLRPAVSPQSWYALLTPNGGEVVSPDW